MSNEFPYKNLSEQHRIKRGKRLLTKLVLEEIAKRKKEGQSNIKLSEDSNSSKEDQ